MKIVDTSGTRALYTLEGAAEYLGVSPIAVGRLVAAGHLPYQELATARVVRIEDLERVKREHYLEEGISASEFAELYGTTRQIVNYYITSRRIEPIGVDRKNRGARKYRAEDLQALADELGWTPVDLAQPEPVSG